MPVSRASQREGEEEGNAGRCRTVLWTEEQILTGGGHRQGVEVGRSMLQESGAGCAPAKGPTTSSSPPAPFPAACSSPAPNPSQGRVCGRLGH